MENNIVLEEELGKVSKKKPQADLFRKQVSELNIKLTSETERADKIAFENAKLMEKLEAISIEKDRIAAEREQLKETLDELKCTQVGHSSPEFSQLTEEPDSGMLENIPPSVKARLLRLEKENKQLKKYKSAGNNGNDTLVLQTVVDDMKEREEELGNKNREANKKVMELEARLEEVQASANIQVPRVPGSREELELKVAEANKKIGHLTETLQKKEAEMAGMEERYKKYIEKAKSVIKTLDPKQNPNAAPEVSALKAQLTEKDKVIDELEKETEKAKAIREMEERLMASAFYDLSMKLHRGPVDSGIRYKELKKENETLKQELESLESQKDETQAKLEELEGRLEESEEKVTELQKLADQARALKDEVDILRETSDKVGKYEGIIETYKKKLDEMGDLKRQIKYLEDKNNEYMENNIVLEEELGKVSKKKPQADLFRKQVSEKY